ncbi:hypothetical protein [Nocardia wallacei]|uniref:hypothetical protein n=1 Tax=Nocardia wallacei TaxID=480035 RepID=UPI002456EECD|nr:hypothetical protein [Nocardia wallacei]
MSAKLERELLILVRQLRRASSCAQTLQTIRHATQALASRAAALDPDRDHHCAVLQLYHYLDSASRSAIAEADNPRSKHTQIADYLVAVLQLLRRAEGFDDLIPIQSLVTHIGPSIYALDADSIHRWALVRFYGYTCWKYERTRTQLLRTKKNLGEVSDRSGGVRSSSEAAQRGRREPGRAP